MTFLSEYKLGYPFTHILNCHALQLGRVRGHIENQEDHYKNKTPQQEYDQWVEKCGIKISNVDNLAKADFFMGFQSTN